MIAKKYVARKLKRLKSAKTTVKVQGVKHGGEILEWLSRAVTLKR